MNNKFKAECLIDIKDIHIDIKKSKAERLDSYINQIKNPYNFKCNGISVTLRFVGDKTLEEKLGEFLTKNNCLKFGAMI